MRKIGLLTLGCVISWLACGCVLIPIALVGGGIIGGIAISEDTVQNELDASYDEVWDASVKVLEGAGAVETKDKEIGEIRGYVPKSKVTITVSQLTPSTVRIQVKARKTAGVVPDIKMAHRVAYRIVQSVQKTSDKGDSGGGK
jgi:hypothetical protein